MRESFDWLRPSPLWRNEAAELREEGFFRPAVLEFATDDFIDEFLAAVADRRPDPLQARIKPLDAAAKLFQPIHGRFYLVAASLACRQPGFPDRAIRRADGESVFFVQRRWRQGVEYAWVPDGPAKGWQVPAPGTLADGEQRLPLFPAATHTGRSVLFGYLPVASRDTYEAAPEDSPIVPEPEDPRSEEFDLKVVRPLGMVLARPPGSIRPVEEIAFFALFDLAEFLRANAPGVVTALQRQIAPSSLPPARQGLVTWLEAQTIDSRSVGELIATIADYAPEDHQEGDALPVTVDLETLGAGFPAALRTEVFRAGVLDPYEPAGPEQPVHRQVPAISHGEGVRYLLRCVYERPQCDPPQRWISPSSGNYALAAVADPDAPVRPIRIALATDVSIAGLRKFQKGVAFSMSAALRNKLARISGVELLDGQEPGPEGNFSLGHICSFSIPIITLCAFILLLIIATILNLVFWWLPFLKICFPLRSSSS